MLKCSNDNKIHQINNPKKTVEHGKDIWKIGTNKGNYIPVKFNFSVRAEFHWARSKQDTFLVGSASAFLLGLATIPALCGRVLSQNAKSSTYIGHWAILNRLFPETYRPKKRHQQLQDRFPPEAHQ